ncbi:MAG: MBL fold metallo-hydrolase, partial [Metallosphaera sp.]
AHTTSDVIVYLPDEKVVFCGDLFFSPPCTPFALMGYISGYIRAIEYLISLNAEVYVPGHGEVGFGNKGLYEELKYLIFVREKAREKLKEGIKDPIKASFEIDLGEYKNWISSERIIGNIARAYSELLGNPPASPIENITQIIAAMMEYRKRFK